MKRIISSFLILSLTICLFSCNNAVENKIDQIEKVVRDIEQNTQKDAPIYKLYPTQNMWNFLKLDTRNGIISIVQFSIEDDNKQFEYPLSITPLCDSSNPGRFILQPTENMYNFIMLDQTTGQTYQVQWSFEENKRFVIPIN